MNYKPFAALGAALTLAACATNSNEIAASYSSPLQYASYDCQQIAMEQQMVVSRASSLGGVIDHRATTDKVMVGVGAVFFWPALFLVKGNGEQAAEFARLKGEGEALEHAAVMKHCIVDSQGRMASVAAQASTMLPALPTYSQPAALVPAAASNRVIGMRVSNGGAVTETTYAPN